MVVFTKALLLILLTVICGSLAGQNKSKFRVEETLGFGTSITTGLSKAVTGNGANYLRAGLIIKSPLIRKSFCLETGLISKVENYFMDGYFIADGSVAGGKRFAVTPDNFKQNKITLESLELPLKIKRYWDDEAIGFGVAGNFYDHTTDKYKIGEQTYETDDLPFRKFQLSACFDFERSIPLKDNYLVVNVQASYQLTSFIAQRSFKPLSFGLNIITPLFSL